ncbi:MAG: aminotransferase class IV [Sedimentisphaerales bacterium]|nr:aminotransferase class IV [Sedimentisphaerales bacterium]
MRGDPKIIHFLDGYLQESAPKAIDRLMPGVLNGPGMFETMRTVKGDVFLLEQHLKRLTRGLELIGLKNPFSPSRWWTVIQKTMDANHLKEARVRLMVWQEGAYEECSVIARPLILPSAAVYRKGYNLSINDAARPVTLLSNVKSTDYGFFLHAYEQARVKLCEDAVILSPEGHVVECSRSNIFWVCNKALFTPSLATGCLSGVTRQAVLNIARQQGIKTSNVKAPLKTLLSFDAAFLTNSIIGVMPVRSIDGQKMNVNDPIMRLLRKEYEKLLRS